MTRFFKSPKFLVAAALGATALGAASVAEAHPDVSFSIGFQGFPAYVEPAPVYVQPRPGYGHPVYVEPAPTYVRPPVFVAPREVFERPGWGGYDGRYELERQRAWNRAEWRRHESREHFGDRDHDRDDRKWHQDYRN